MADREQLESWIAQTQRNKRKLGIGITVGGVVATSVLVIDRTAGLLAMMCIAIVAFFGFWIMSSHITEWEAHIQELGRPKPVGRAGRKR